MNEAPQFKSEYFDTPDELVQAKDQAWKTVAERRKRLKLVRQFTNMLPTLSDEEMEQLGRTEATNFGLAYRAMLQNEKMFTSMTNQTNALVEIIVDTDNVEKDTELGIRLSEAINRGAVHYKGKFAGFWRKVAGEITIAGGSPVVFPPCYGWLPELKTDMFFPRKTDLDSENVTYGFNATDLKMSDLKKLRKSIRAGSTLFKNEIDALIETLKKQIKDQQGNYGSGYNDEEQTSQSVRGEDRYDDVATIKAWEFYEVKYKENGDQYVSRTLFTDGVCYLNEKVILKASDSTARIVAYEDKAYDNADDFLRLVCVDSEIGGVKNLDTLRGVAELVYPSSVELEELLNLVLEGDKIRAKPRYQVTDAANEDKVLAWNMALDSFAPPGVVEMEHKTNAQHLLTPFGLLQQNVAGLSAGPQSNNGGGKELRVQALQRGQSDSEMTSDRAAEGYNHLDAILETVVWRILAGETKPGTEGYRETMWIRKRLEKYGIDYKALAKRTYGRFDFLKVRAKRISGNGNREQQIGTADWIMDNVQNFPPASRPLALKMATQLRTNDPDLADALVQLPKAILNAQKVTAENEADTIRRRSALGQVLPTMPDDIHNDHVPVHLQDMQALVARNEFRPWDKLDLMEFAGLVEHTGEHIEIMLANPVSNMEAKIFLRDYQMIVQGAQTIAADVQEREGNEVDKLTPKERAELELKYNDQQLKAMALGLKADDLKNVQQQREARQIQSNRSQYAKEVSESRRLELEQSKVELQAKAQDQPQD